MATKWPQKRRLIGTKVSRIDGPQKTTGRAKYTLDMNLQGMLHAGFVRCPYAHATVTKIDTSAAEKAPGFRALHLMVKEGAELFFPGEWILAIAANTEEECRDALRLVKVEYKQLPFQVKEEDVREKDLATCPEGGPKKSR